MLPKTNTHFGIRFLCSLAIVATALMPTTVFAAGTLKTYAATQVAPSESTDLDALHDATMQQVLELLRNAGVDDPSEVIDAEEYSDSSYMFNDSSGTLQKMIYTKRIINFVDSFSMTQEMRDETGRTDTFLINAVNTDAQTEIDMIEANTQQALESPVGRNPAYAPLANTLNTTSAALTRCIDEDPSNWKDTCEDEYDAYDDAQAALRDAAGTAPVSGSPAGSSGTPAGGTPSSSPTGSAAGGSGPAASGSCPEGDILCMDWVNPLVDPDDGDKMSFITRLRREGFSMLFQDVTKGFTGVAATFAFVGLLYGSFLYVTAHGNEEQLTKAKQFILLTLLGLVLLTLSYVILTGIRDILYEQP